MLKKCLICGKGVMTGHNVSRRGLAKKKGGTGKKTTRVTKRRFLPNLRKIRMIVKGKVKRGFVCVKCFKAGKVEIHSPRNLLPAENS
jgi:large subunit ribosomal protein L28